MSAITHPNFVGAIERWRICPSTHCERWQECRSPNECSGTGKNLTPEQRAALTPAVAGEKIEFRRQWIEQIRDQLFAMGQLPSGPLGDWAFLFREMLTDALAQAQEPGKDKR